jgi:heme-degrading monooxygenase HmoA
MITLEARCSSGHYLAAIVPISGLENETRYQVLVFRHGVECQAKKGKTDVLARKLHKEVLPALQRQPGFIDLVALTDDKNDERVVCLSFWSSKESVERYQREHYDTIVQTLESELDGKPTLETLEVAISTAHRIASSNAA